MIAQCPDGAKALWKGMIECPGCRVLEVSMPAICGTTANKAEYLFYAQPKKVQLYESEAVSDFFIKDKEAHNGLLPDLVCRDSNLSGASFGGRLA